MTTNKKQKKSPYSLYISIFLGLVLIFLMYKINFSSKERVFYRNTFLVSYLIYFMFSSFVFRFAKRVVRCFVKKPLKAKSICLTVCFSFFIVTHAFYFLYMVKNMDLFCMTKSIICMGCYRYNILGLMFLTLLMQVFLFQYLDTNILNPNKTSCKSKCCKNKCNKNKK